MWVCEHTLAFAHGAPLLTVRFSRYYNSMAESSSFTETLAQSLEEYGEQLTSSILPALKNELRTYHGSFQGLANLLIRKAVVDEDPYKHDYQISEIATPPEQAFAESERDHMLSTRVSYYGAMLEYITNYYRFSLESLTLREIKKLGDFIGYFKWSRFAANSSHPATKALAEAVQKLREGADHMTSDIAQENVNQLAKSAGRIFDYLKQVTEYQKQRWKLLVRRNIMEQISLPDDPYQRKDAVVEQLRREYGRSRSVSGPFYRELVLEVVEEDYGPKSGEKREEVVQRLKRRTTVKGHDQPKKQQPLRQTLMESLRALANTGRHLEECVIKMTDNSQAYESVRRTLWDRIKQWFRVSVQKEKPRTAYEVEFTDIATAAKHTETIDFEHFTHRVSKKARQLSLLLNRRNPSYRKLEALDEDRLLVFLSKSIEEVQLFHRTLSALDQYFKENAPSSIRNQIRGIKIELSHIRNGIVKANQLKQDYVSRKEAEEQLKKLGVEDS